MAYDERRVMMQEEAQSRRCDRGPRSHVKIGLLLSHRTLTRRQSPYPHQSTTVSRAPVTDEVLTAEEHGFDSVWTLRWTGSGVP